MLRGRAPALALALCLAVSPRAQGEQPLPAYPGTVHTRIGNDLVIGGEYYRLAYFTTDDSMKKVARYFERQWREEGYPVTVDGDFEDEGVVSAFYTREGLMRSIVLRKHEGKTLAFSVLKDLWLQQPQVKADKLPALEGTVFSQDVMTRDDDGRTQHRAQLVEAPLDEARNRAVASWQNAGYTMVRETKVPLDGKQQRVLEFQRKGEQALVTLGEMDGKVTAVQQVWVGSDRPDAVPNDTALQKARAARAGEKK